MTHLIRLAMLIATTSLIPTIYAADAAGCEQAEAAHLREGEHLTTIFPKELTLAQLRTIQVDGYHMVSGGHHLTAQNRDHFDTVVPSGIKIVSNHLTKATRQTIDLTSTNIIDDKTIATYTAKYTFRGSYDRQEYSFALVCTVRFPVNLETVTLKAQASRRGELTRRVVLPQLISYREVMRAAKLTPELIATFKSLELNYDFFAISIDSTENAVQYVTELTPLVRGMFDICRSDEIQDPSIQEKIRELKGYFDGIGRDKLEEARRLIPEHSELIQTLLGLIEAQTQLYQLAIQDFARSDSLRDNISPIRN